MKEILFLVIALGGIGALFALLLAFAGKFFAVERDERLPLIEEALPGANCGGCGFAGCSACAVALRAFA